MLYINGASDDLAFDWLLSLDFPSVDIRPGGLDGSNSNQHLHTGYI